MSADEDEADSSEAEAAASEDGDGWVDEADFEEGDSDESPELEPSSGSVEGEQEEREGEEREGEEREDEADEDAVPEKPAPARPAIHGRLAEHLKRVGAAMARLGLAEAERAHDHLAESALWLAFGNLDLELGGVVEAWLAGEAWAPIAIVPRTPELERLALGLALLDAARQETTPASARALAALAAITLGAADPPLGRRLQPACAELGLLPITEQVPVALPIRQAVLEFRHLDLREDPSPVFMARLEDLLDRIDRTELLGVRLADHPAAAPDPQLAWWTALVGSRSPSLILLAKLKLGPETRGMPAQALLSRLAEHDSSWTEAGAESRLEALERTLTERLPAGTLPPPAG